MGVDDLDTASPDVSAETLDDVVASPAEAVVAGTEADSSSAPQAKDEKSVLSIVRDAVQSETPEPSTGEKRDPQAAQPKEPDEENFSDAPFHNHPRFRALIQQRNELRAPAESYRKIEAFCTENAIASEEAAQALNWLALMKRDPAAAWNEIKPTIQTLLGTIGEILPQDLREKVAGGQMTLEVAKALSKERAKATIATGAMSFRDQQDEARQRAADQQARQRKVATCVGAAREWETAARSVDADFVKKAEALEKEVRWLQHKEGVPDTAEGVKQQLTKAKKAVDASIAALRPRRPSVQPVVGGSTSGTPRAQPKSVLEIVQNGG
jgi:ribosomal protein L19E